jgi:hypothetical protein
MWSVSGNDPLPFDRSQRSRGSYHLFHMPVHSFHRIAYFASLKKDAIYSFKSFGVFVSDNMASDLKMTVIVMF